MYAMLNTIISQGFLTAITLVITIIVVRSIQKTRRNSEESQRNTQNAGDSSPQGDYVYPPQGGQGGYDSPPPPQGGYHSQPPFEQDAPSKGFAILGFVLPAVGLVLYLVWSTSLPLRARSAGKGALIRAIVAIALSIVLLITNYLLIDFL